MTTLLLYEMVTRGVGGRTGSGGNQAAELITIFVESYQVTFSPCALNVSFTHRALFVRRELCGILLPSTRHTYNAQLVGQF
jgi:hypothetical protein